MSQAFTREYEVLHDRARLQEIADLGLESTEVDALLQDVAARAARHFGLPVGLVSIVLDDAQHFAASYGLGGWLEQTRGTPVEWSFCRVPVTTREPLVVSNASLHSLVKDSPLVRVDGIRCYAGTPLISSKGYALGSFCVLGPEVREFSTQDLEDLRGFATEAVTRIEQRRRAL